MRLVRNLSIFLLALYLGIILFMPKSNLYYKAEELLKKQGIVIGNEELKSSLVGLKVMHPVAYYQGLDVARASIIDAKVLLFVNTLSVEDIELLGVAKNLNIDIKSLKANHSILNPFYIKLNINGSFGVATGYVDLNSKVVHIDIIEPKDINPIKRYLKKAQKGWYYESKF